MLRRRERRRAIDRVGGKRLIVLDHDRVRSCRGRAPQIGRHRQDARRCDGRGRRVLRTKRVEDEAATKDERCRQGKPAHVSDCHLAVSSMDGRLWAGRDVRRFPR
jgi:hypothetical protein